MSKLNKILGVFIFLLVVSSCSKEDDEKEETFKINGTYKVDKVSKADQKEDKFGGTFDVKKQSGGKYQLSTKDLALGSLIKDMSLDLLGTVTEIDSKAYEVVFENAKGKTKIPFSHSITLDDSSPLKLKTLLGTDKVEFSSDAEMNLTVDFQPAKKITYGGKQYKGVIQKDQAELAMRITASATITITRDKLAASIKNPSGVDVKKNVNDILTYSDVDVNKRQQRQALELVLNGYVAKLAAGVPKDDANWVLTLKKQ